MLFHLAVLALDLVAIVGRAFEGDGVAFALVHLVAGLVAHQSMAEKGFEGCLGLEHGAHCQQGIEPVAELAGEALGDEVGWKPLFPICFIFVVAHG